MNFLAPERLWLLAGVAVLAAAYLMLQRRRRQYAVRFTNLELLASVAPRRPGWRRHLPSAATLGALILLVVGFAQPTRTEKVPRENAMVMLAIDTSVSMKATDVSPNRLDAAQRAAVDFTGRLPTRIRLGLVAFDGIARVLVPPTTDRSQMRSAIGNLELGPGTAAGEAIFTSLESIQPTVREAARIVVMSDGKTTVGRPPEDAAEAAKEAGVPVSTIAFGTDEGYVTLEGRIVPVPVDRAALRRIAETTGGQFFEAASGDELKRIYAGIGSSAGEETEQREMTAVFLGLGMAFLAAAATGSLVWTNRLP